MIRRILLAVDMSANSPVTLGFAQEMASQFSAKIEILHVIEPVGVFAQAVLDTYAPDQALYGKGLEPILNHLRQSMTDNFISEFDDASMLAGVHVEVGRPAEVVVDYLKMSSIDLVIFGSSHSGDVGAIAQKVMRSQKAPVMVVPQVIGNIDTESTRQFSN